MVMVAARRHESGAVAHPHESDRTRARPVEGERAIDVGDFQVDVSDAGAGGNPVVLHRLQFNPCEG